MKKHLKVIVALLLVLVTLSPMALATSRGAKVLTSGMTVYNSKKTKVGTLARGTSITVTGYSGKWVRFKYKGKTYYGKGSCVVLNSGKAAVTKKDAYFEFVTKASFSKGTYYKATLAAGTKVYIVGRSGSKYLVKNAKGNALGYISKSAVA